MPETFPRRGNYQAPKTLIEVGNAYRASKALLGLTPKVLLEVGNVYRTPKA